MKTVTVSSKFQVTIPKTIREELNLVPGEQLHAFRYLNRIELIPVRPIEEFRGCLRGIDTNIEREDDLCA